MGKPFEIVLETNVTKVGNSIYILIPRKIVARLKEEGLDLEKAADEKTKLLIKMKIIPSLWESGRIW